MTEYLSTEKTNGNGVRAKAVGIIQAGFAELSDESLVEIAKVVITYRRFASLAKFLEQMNESTKVVQS